MQDVEQRVKQYLVERGWDNLRPSDVAKSISIEAAELLELFQWSSPTLEETKADTAKLELLKGELADVLIYALDMAVLLELDTKQIIFDKLDKVSQKYPAELMKPNAKRDNGSGTDQAYLDIKQAYRRRS